MLLGLRGTIAVNLLDVANPVEVLRASGAWERVAVPHERAQGPDHLLGLEHLVDCVQNGVVPEVAVVVAPPRMVITQVLPIGAVQALITDAGPSPAREAIAGAGVQVVEV